jgi:peroxiredoxin Q/BCP
MLETGRSAPDFELPDESGEPVSLSAFEGQTVVLYFYPKARTPGCTTEAQGFRDNWAAFEEAGIQVLGISADPPEELRKFKQEEDLPFPLLSDADGEVASAYESYGAREIRGQTYEIAFRNSYVVDESGDIAAVYEDVSPEGHAEEVLEDTT